MSAIGAILAFTAAATALTVTPGLDTALVLGTLNREGPARAMQAAVGIGLGCLIWGIAIGMGLGAVLSASALFYDLLRWIGAAYLLMMGLQLFMKPEGDPVAKAAPFPPHRGGNALRRGLMTNLLNPKVGMFYLSFLPQFVPPGAAIVVWVPLLTAIHAALGLVWFAILIRAGKAIIGPINRPAIARWLDHVLGTILIGFALRLAIQSAART